MNFTDGVQETTNATSAATVALLGAAAGGPRTFVAGFTVGATNIPVRVGDALGNFEIGLYTFTSSALLTRTAILASSNGGAAVIFPAGTKTVTCVLPARSLLLGLVDPDDAGYDIILLIGQSNMAGRGVLDALVEIADNRVWQFGGKSADARYQTIFAGNDPLHNFEFVNTAQMSLGTVACKAYAAIRPANRRVLMVPCSNGGTPLFSGAANWSVGGSLYLNAISQANAAITAAQLQYPNSRFVGCLWHQGESDALAGVSQANYQTALTNAIAGYRSGITGASNSWFVIGGMVPEAISGSPSSYNPIVAAHQAVAAATNRCAYVAGPSGVTGDNLHYNAAGCRIMGARMALAIRTAEQYSATDVTAPTVSSAAVANATPTFVDFTMSEAMDTAFTPAAATVTISGHTVSALAYVSSMILRVTVNALVNGEVATAAYTSNGTNNLRDAAGNQMANFTARAITNNVIGAATAVSMTGPTGGVSGVASTNFTLGVTPLTGTISGTLVVTPADSGAGGTFTPTTRSLTTASPTGTFTYTPASAGAKTISVTNNGGLANPANITYTASASATVPATMAAPTATAGAGTVSVAYVAPADGGSAITSYTATHSTGPTVSGTANPLVLTVANGVAGTVTIIATNGVGPSLASPASNSVTPAAADLRARAGFTGLTEGGSTGAWTYTGTGGAAFDATGAVVNQGRAANALSSFSMVRQAAAGNGDKLCIAVMAGTAPLALASRVFTFLHGGDGVYTGFAGGGSITPSGPAHPQSCAVGDIMRVRFATATSLACEVSKDGGATWLLIHTQTTGVPATALNFQVQLLAAATGRCGGFVGVNLTAN